MQEDVLQIEFQPVFDKWAWRIIYQNTDVLERGKFKDEEIGVISYLGPSFYKEEVKLYIQGENINSDNDIEMCTTEEKILIEYKVKAINEKYGIKKRWRAKKMTIITILIVLFQ